MDTPSRETIYTIGHSTRSLEEFIALLRANGVELLADVRTVPKSRTNPQFDRETIPQSLEDAQIEYMHFPELGGWRSTGFKNYADYMLTKKFEVGIDRLIAAALERRTAIMCAEVLPWRCHRNLISDALTVRGFRVIHIISKTGIQEHSVTSWAVVFGTSITYPHHQEV